ncbi:MAG: hypothetical protein AAGF73_11965 [Actinomycetota bacterium]
MSDIDPDREEHGSFESSLQAALRERSDLVDVAPDRAELGRRERRYRRRRSTTRVALGAATVAVVTVGVVGLVANSSRTNTTESPTNASVESTVSPQTSEAGTASDEWFLVDTNRVYERTRTDGSNIVVRTADRPFADFADVEWSAPTGSAELCFGERTVLFGFGVGDETQWTARGRFTEPDQPISAIVTTPDLQQPSSSERTVTLLNVPAGAATIVLTAHDGDETDRAPVQGQYAVIEFFGPDHRDESDDLEYPTVTALDADGAVIHSASLFEVRSNPDWAPPECVPPPRPPQPLPPPGEQPADPAAAEASIRSRHALLVDRSIDSDDKPDDLLTDNTGIDAALEKVDAGQYSDSAAGAAYTIDELVFVAPDHAWFRYTIDAPTGLFPDRFGQARLVDGSWSITRSTICNDLALAGGRCEPEWTYEAPPIDPQWAEANDEWHDIAGRYVIPGLSDVSCIEPLRC